MWIVLLFLVLLQVSVFGFGADRYGNWHHYWEENHLAGAFRHTGVHDGDYEYNVTLLLADKHKIQMFKGRWYKAHMCSGMTTKWTWLVFWCLFLLRLTWRALFVMISFLWSVQFSVPRSSYNLRTVNHFNSFSVFPHMEQERSSNTATCFRIWHRNSNVSRQEDKRRHQNAGYIYRTKMLLYNMCMLWPLTLNKLRWQQ